MSLRPFAPCAGPLRPSRRTVASGALACLLVTGCGALDQFPEDSSLQDALSPVVASSSATVASDPPAGSEPAAAARIEPTPAALDFGQTLEFYPLLLRSTDGGPVEYTIHSNVPWLSTDHPAGSIVAGWTWVAARVDRRGLPPGTHQGQLTLATTAHVTSIDVTMTVAAPAAAPPEVADELAATTAQATVSGDVPSAEQILAWLRELKPLQKVHYSAPPPKAYYLNADPLMDECARLMGALTLLGPSALESDIDAAVQLYVRVRDASGVRLKLGLLFSPYKYELPEGVRPTYAGPEVQQAWDNFQSKLASVRTWLAAENAAQGAALEVGALLLDTERWRVKPAADPNAPAWNAAMDAKYDAYADIARAYIPLARIEWYGRGDVVHCSDPSGWCNAPYFTLREQGDSLSSSLYEVADAGYTREKFRRTTQLADAAGPSHVTPWIALGCGKRRGVDGVHWTYEWNYDLYESWAIGAEVNIGWFGDRPNRYAPWDYADIVVIYPGPFNPSPYWPQHFVAYVRGANLLKELPE